MSKRLGVRNKDSGMARSVAEQAAPDEHAGAGQLMDIALGKVLGNERNPRFRAVTPEQVMVLRDEALAATAQSDTVSDAFFDKVGELIEGWSVSGSDELTIEDCRARLQGIAALAHSIRRINLIQPIVVYPQEGGYEVVAGQRRYLAHVLLGRKEIRAIVRQPSGDRLHDSLAAVVENLSREELSLRERVEAIEEIVNLHEGASDHQMSAAELKAYLGESKRTCQRYLRIVRDTTVKEGVRNGEVTGLRQAAQLVDPPAAAATEGAATQGDARSSHLTRSAPVGRQADQVNESESKGKAKRAARPKERVQLGKVSRAGPVWRLMESVLGTERLSQEYGEVDWDDLRDVENAWKHFLTHHVLQEGE